MVNKIMITLQYHTLNIYLILINITDFIERLKQAKEIRS